MRSMSKVLHTLHTVDGASARYAGVGGHLAGTLAAEVKEIVQGAVIDAPP